MDDSGFVAVFTNGHDIRDARVFVGEDAYRDAYQAVFDWLIVDVDGHTDSESLDLSFEPDHVDDDVFVLQRYLEQVILDNPHNEYRFGQVFETPLEG